MSTFSVTEVRNALRCPRLFALGRARGRPVVFPVGSSSLGATFHRLVDRFARMAGSPPEALARLTPEAPSEEVIAALRAWLLELLIDELEATPALASMPAEVDDLADALRDLAGYAGSQVKSWGGRPAEGLVRFLRGSEVDVRADITLGDGESVELSGRIDALHVAPDGEVHLVEYKLTDETDAELDRMQVVLYARMLRLARGVSAHPVVLRFSPQMEPSSVTHAEAERLFDERVVPVLRGMFRWEATVDAAPATPRKDLCAHCPLRAECAATYPDALPPRDDPPAGAAAPRPEPSGALRLDPPSPPRVAAAPDVAGEREAERLRKLLADEFKRLHVPVVFNKAPVVGPTLITLELSVQRGKVRALDAAVDDVRHRLVSAHKVQAEYSNRAGLRAFEFARNPRRPVLLAELLGRAEAFLRERPGRFVLGETPRGELLRGDFSDHTCAHLLVGGMTGSGKSVLLRAVAASLVQYHPPAALQLTLIDPKRVTFQKSAAQLGTHLARPVAYDVEVALEILVGLIELMEERYRAFESARVEDLEDFNEQCGARERLPRHVVLVDEFQDMVLSSKRVSEEFLGAVQRLGAKARAAGIHLVLATQRPDAKTVPGAIKANLPGKVALRVQSATNSRIILDQKGAESLLGGGDMLADLGEGVVRAQGPLA